MKIFMGPKDSHNGKKMKRNSYHVQKNRSLSKNNLKETIVERSNDHGAQPKRSANRKSVYGGKEKKSAIKSTQKSSIESETIAKIDR